MRNFGGLWMSAKSQQYIYELKYKLFMCVWKLFHPPRVCEFKSTCSYYNIESVTCNKEPSSYCGTRKAFLKNLEKR